MSLNDGSFIFLLFYVDDMFIVSYRVYGVNKLKNMLRNEFDMKYISVFMNILSLEIDMDKSAKKLWLS